MAPLTSSVESDCFRGTMKTFTLALCASTTLFFTACSDTLYSHRPEFGPKKGSGPWHNAYDKLKHRPLTGEKKAPASTQRRVSNGQAKG